MGGGFAGASLVLVVEDEPVIGLFVVEALRHAGFRCAGPAASAVEALALLATGPRPDAAVLDVRLRAGNALPVAEALASRGVPFVFATAAARDEMTEAFANRPTLRKPYSSDALVAAVRALNPSVRAAAAAAALLAKVA